MFPLVIETLLSRTIVSFSGFRSNYPLPNGGLNPSLPMGPFPFSSEALYMILGPQRRFRRFLFPQTGFLDDRIRSPARFHPSFPLSLRQRLVPLPPIHLWQLGREYMIPFVKRHSPLPTPLAPLPGEDIPGALFLHDLGRNFSVSFFPTDGSTNTGLAPPARCPPQWQQ